VIRFHQKQAPGRMAAVVNAENEFSGYESPLNAEGRQIKNRAEQIFKEQGTCVLLLFKCG
jgi:hypothetical protein